MAGRIRWAMGLVVVAFAGWTCVFGIDPAKGTFSCQSDSDCGAGYECRAQAMKETGRCFSAGSCAAEVCDGVDNDCNGVVDDETEGAGEPCDSGRPGLCGPGKKVCADGSLQCRSVASPVAEECDGADNDCDGLVDEDFDFMRELQHCGACKAACRAGTSCVLGGCVESDCANQADDDQDGKADCEDSDCAGLPCQSGSGAWNCGRAALLPDGGSSDGGLVDGGLPDGGGGPIGFDCCDAGLCCGIGPCCAGAPDGGPSDGGGGPIGFDCCDAGLCCGIGPCCAGNPDAGYVRACVPVELVCGDGADNDLDGNADCADSDCEGRACGAGKVCGSGSCH